MAKNPNALTASQVAVLRWIASGCPDGLYTEGWEHRIAARALERRGLVSIVGRGPSWKATTTKAGRAWLAASPADDVLPSDSEPEALVALVVDAGGVLVVEAERGDELKTLERLVRATIRATNRPRGQQLELSGHDYYARTSKRTLKLVPHFEDFVEPRPVPVAEHVTKYHPVVRYYLDNRDWQYVSKDALSRAARILQAIALEAERRGFQVKDPSTVKANQGAPRYKPIVGHLWLVTPHGPYSVEVRETSGKGSRARDYQERHNSREPIWLSRRQTAFIATGQLDIILGGRHAPYMGQHFKDSKRSSVEVKLPELFAALDKYQFQAAWHDEQQRLREEEERRRKEAARATARVRFQEQARWAHFESLVAAHEEADRKRRFVDAAVEAATSLDGAARAAAETYLREMRERVDTQDPLRRPELLVPVIPTPSNDQLKPYL